MTIPEITSKTQCSDKECIKSNIPNWHECSDI